MMLLPTHSTTLRSALTTLRFQPTTLVVTAPSCFSTRTWIPSPRRRFPSPTCAHSLLRSASTTTTTSSNPITTTTTTALQPLTWNAYLALRKTRRRYNLASSLASSLLTTAGAMTALTRLNLEQVNVLGLDPFLVLGLITIGSGAAGWLLGPFVGNAVFGMVHRRLGRQIAEKERDFYRRIKKHRVDPSGGSSANPVPDYYGEKIGSVRGYRDWLKDQRAFNKRRQNFL